mmetsp:Transcript_13296/g.20639  ORF Transcript_13296/g.20639 Transcript_13296/m.20639 type:complete len:664 (-) Transcript_13296:159-2150(-)
MEGVSSTGKRHYEIFNEKNKNHDKRFKPENDNLLTTSELTESNADNAVTATVTAQNTSSARTINSGSRKFRTVPLKKLSGGKQRTNDSIHRSIDFFPVLQALVDTPAGQRLKKLKQLGCSSIAYMNAIHTRFEHSAGVAHLAGLMCRRIQSFQPLLDVSEKDHHCVVVAGFCHDWGHGPFSHVFDGAFQKGLLKKGLLKKSRKWEHEELSLMLIDAMLSYLGLQIDESRMEEPLLQIGDGIQADCFGVYSSEVPLPSENVFTSRDMIFIKECILGKPLKGQTQFLGRKWNKHFLYDIVNNTHSGLDVDKMDYYARDMANTLGSGQVEQLLIEEAFVARAHCCGSPKCFRCDLGCMENGDEEQTRLMICYPKKRIVKAMDFFKTRFKMHTDVYTHKTCQAGEILICDILMLADPYIKLRGNACTTGEFWRISTAVTSPDAYLRLNDSIVDIISASDNPSLKPAQALVERYNSRKLYKCVCSERLSRKRDEKIWNMGDEELEDKICSELLEIRDDFLDEASGHYLDSIPENFNENANSWDDHCPKTTCEEDSADIVTFERKDFVVTLRKIHHGMKEENPVQFMRFLSKDEILNLEKCRASDLPIASAVDEELYECHIPREFYEKSIRVYNRSESERVSRSIQLCIREWFRRERRSDESYGTLSQL